MAAANAVPDDDSQDQVVFRLENANSRRLVGSVCVKLGHCQAATRSRCADTFGVDSRGTPSPHRERASNHPPPYEPKMRAMLTPIINVFLSKSTKERPRHPAAQSRVIATNKGTGNADQSPELASSVPRSLRRIRRHTPHRRLLVGLGRTNLVEGALALLRFIQATTCCLNSPLNTSCAEVYAFVST
jgi:hypothetical protein